MIDRVLFFTVLSLITIGVISSYTLSSYTVKFHGYDDFHFVIREVATASISIFIIWLLARQNPDKSLHIVGFTLFFGGFALMIAMPFLPSEYVQAVGGAKRWIKLPLFSIAPVEFFKIGFVYFLAWSFSRKYSDNSELSVADELKRFVPYGAIFFVSIIFIAILQNDLGQVVVLTGTLAVFLAFAGSSMKFFIALGTAASGVLFAVIVFSEHRISRILSWWASAQNSILVIFPESIASHLRVENASEGYQIGHSLNAIHNGGLFGTGLGGGTFKLGFLSEVHTDFVLAGLAEEFGFLGVFIVTMLFIVLILRIFRIANRINNSAYSLFSIGVGLVITFAFLINAYGISGIIPIKGIAVPFLSYGGSNMLASAVGIGMVLMISKNIHKRERL